MHRPINGWTKEKIIETLNTKNIGKPSRKEGGQCAYFGENNNRCAVGCFIPDEFVETVKEWEEKCIGDGENYGAVALFEHFPEIKFPLDQDVLDSLQSVHDHTDKTSDPRPKMVKWVEENVA